MELDAKQKVLVAIYTEYQKDLPDMDSITPVSVGLEQPVFNTAVDKLQSEEYIKNASLLWADQLNYPSFVVMSSAKMTRDGIDYVQTKLQIDDTLSGNEKVKEVMKKTATWGWDQIKDFGAKVLAEMIKS